MKFRRLTGPAAWGALALASSPAFASGGGCATCYRHVVQPPVYGVVSEQVMVRPPQTFERVIPAEYATVAESVLVAPARRVWQVTYDAYGQAIGCWVSVPAQYAVRHRSVLVRPPKVVQEVVPAVFETRHRKVLVQPGRSAWQPVGYHGY